MRNFLKSMSRLGLLLAVLTSTAAASADGGPYWAVARDVFQIKSSGGAGPQSYGAAWNFPSREEAAEAAFEACGRESPRGECNTLASSGMNSCFFVLSHVTDDKYLGRYKLFGASGSEGYPSRAEAEAAAKRSGADTYTNIPDRIHHVGTIELLECFWG
ncbi:MAG: hypothetical protein F4092_12220 [Rhodospirillaceae bacterium]|nr:hypothetical protein [Rhodospirillaceae bacterium]MYJ72509.1 hypothetical protein [Rhodospirillaceae bacterium]